jgi:uncharacterized protein YjiS (DUF1127 family)
MSKGASEMTYTADFLHPGVRLREWFETGKKAVIERRSRRSSYLRTLYELECSSDRDLADLGFSRLSIKEIAYETAYGDQSSQTVNPRT